MELRKVAEIIGTVLFGACGFMICGLMLGLSANVHQVSNTAETDAIVRQLARIATALEHETYRTTPDDGAWEEFDPYAIRLHESTDLLARFPKWTWVPKKGASE